MATFYQMVNDAAKAEEYTRIGNDFQVNIALLF